MGPGRFPAQAQQCQLPHPCASQSAARLLCASKKVPSNGCGSQTVGTKFGKSYRSLGTRLLALPGYKQQFLSEICLQIPPLHFLSSLYLQMRALMLHSITGFFNSKNKTKQNSKRSPYHTVYVYMSIYI